MKSKGQGTAEQLVIAPKGWQYAGLDSVARISRENRPWLEAQGRRRNQSALIDTHCPTVATKRDAIVFTSAKENFWRDLALRYEEILKDHGIRTRTPRSLLNAILKHMPERLAKQPPKWGDRRTINYVWLEVQHRGADLRDALGYSETQFRKLVREFSRSPIRTAGRDKFYPRRLVMKLLAHRLGTTAAGKRAKIAQEIWEHARGLTRQRLHDLRSILSKAGAKCGRPPKADFPASALGGF